MYKRNNLRNNFNDNVILESIYHNLITNNLDDKFVLQLVNDALSLCNFSQNDLSLFVSIKGILIRRDLFFDLMGQILSSFDTRMIARASLLLDSSLVKKFYGSIDDMYLYLSHTNSIPREEADLMMKYILSKKKKKSSNKSSNKIIDDVEKEKIVKFVSDVDENIYRYASYYNSQNMEKSKKR